MAARETVFPATASALARVAGAALPTGLLLTGEDNLKVSVLNVAPSLTLAVDTRFLVAGQPNVTANEHRFVPTTGGVNDDHFVGLADGILMNVVVRALNERVERGQCYVRVDVVRGESARVTLGTLISGYIGSWGGRAWPGSPLESPVDGAGWVHMVQGTVPAAGQPAFLILPQETRWRVICCNSILVTSAVVASRNVYLVTMQSSTQVGLSLSSLPHPASNSITHSFGAGVTPTTPTPAVFGMGALPVPLILSTRGAADAMLRLNASNMQAGDQFGAIFALVEEWRNPVTIAAD